MVAHSPDETHTSNTTKSNTPKLQPPPLPPARIPSTNLCPASAAVAFRIASPARQVLAVVPHTGFEQTLVLVPPTGTPPSTRPGERRLSEEADSEDQDRAVRGATDISAMDQAEEEESSQSSSPVPQLLPRTAVIKGMGRAKGKSRLVDRAPSPQPQPLSPPLACTRRQRRPQPPHSQHSPLHLQPPSRPTSSNLMALAIASESRLDSRLPPALPVASPPLPSPATPAPRTTRSSARAARGV